MSWSSRQRPLSPSVTERYSVPLSARYPPRESEFNSPPRPDTRYRPLSTAEVVVPDRYRSTLHAEYPHRRVGSMGAAPISPPPPALRSSPALTHSRDKYLPPAVSPRIGHRPVPSYGAPKEEETQAVAKSLQAALEVSQHESRNLAKQLRDVHTTRDIFQMPTPYEGAQHKEELRDLDAKRYQSRISNLEAEVQSRRESGSGDRKIQSLESQIRSSNEELHRVQSDLRVHRSRIDADGKKLRESASTIISLQKELKYWKDKKGEGDPDLRHELNALQEKYSSNESKVMSLQTQLHAHRNEVSQLQEENGSLSRLSEGQGNSLLDLQSRHDQLAESNAILKQHEAAVQQKHEREAQQLEEAKGALSDKDNDIRIRDQRISQLECSTEASKRKASELEAKLQDLLGQRSAYEAAKKECVDLREQLHHAASDVAQLNSKINEGEAEESRMRSKLVEYEETCAQFEQLQDERQRFASALGKEEAVSTELRTMLEHRDELVHKLEADCAQHTEDSDAVQQVVADLGATNADLTEKLAMATSAHTEVEERDARISQLESTCNRWERDAVELGMQAEDSLTKLKEEEEASSLLRSELEEYSQRVGAMESQLGECNDLKVKCGQQRALLKEGQTQVADLENKLTAATTELVASTAEAKVRVAQLEETCSQLQSEADARREASQEQEQGASQARELQEKLNDTQEQCAIIEASLHTSEEESKRRQEALAVKEAECSARDEELQRLSSALEEETRARVELLSDFERHSGQLRALEDAQQQAAADFEEVLHAKKVLEAENAALRASSASDTSSSEDLEKKGREVDLEGNLAESSAEVDVLQAKLEFQSREADAALAEKEAKIEQLMGRLDAAAQGGPGTEELHQALVAKETECTAFNESLERLSSVLEEETKVKDRLLAELEDRDAQLRAVEVESRDARVAVSEDVHVTLLKEKAERMEHEALLHEETADMEGKMLDAIVAAHSHRVEFETAAQRAELIKLRYLDAEARAADLQEHCLEREGRESEGTSVTHLEQEVEMSQLARRAAEEECNALRSRCTEAEAATAKYACRLAEVERQLPNDIGDCDFQSCTEGETVRTGSPGFDPSGIVLLRESADASVDYLDLLDGKPLRRASLAEGPGFKGLEMLSLSHDMMLPNLETGNFFANTGNGLHVLGVDDTTHSLQLLRRAFEKNN